MSSPPFLNNPNKTGGSHTGEDVGIHAMGPDSEALVGLMDFTDIFTVMARHLGVGER